MEKLINFAVNLMEKENKYSNDPLLLPSQNPDINPMINGDINPMINPDINATQRPNLHFSQNPNWKQAQWDKFKELIFWEYLTDEQKEKCKAYLKGL